MFKREYLSEKHLIEMLSRIGRSKARIREYSAFYISTSKLKPKFFHPDFSKVVARFFDDVIENTKSSLFKLGNGDFIIIGKNVLFFQVEEIVESLRLGFIKNSIIIDEDSDDFIKEYHFAESYEFFYQYIDDILFNIGLGIGSDVAYKTKDFEAKDYDKVRKDLDKADLSKIIKRQGCFFYDEKQEPKTLFQEFFVAGKDLGEFEKNINISKNKWLSLYLSWSMDRKMLSTFFDFNITKWPEYISINLSLVSIFTHQFVSFAKNFLKSQQKIIVEVRLVDVLQNIDLYLEAKEILHRGGNKILIDEFEIESTAMVDIEKLEPDFVKIFWDDLMKYDTRNQSLEEVVKKLGASRFVLSKVSSQDAINWAKIYGISNFQGSFMDKIEVENIMRVCNKSKECTEEKCRNLRKMTSGLYVDDCPTKIVFEEYL